MKIIITAVGSTGDIQPFVALAEALKKSGHTVKVCSYSIYKKKFDKINVPFAAAGPPIDDDRVGEVRDTLKKLNPLKQLDYLVKEVFLYEGEKFYNDCIEASRGYHFAVCHSLDFLGQHVMIKNQIPWASVILTPGIIPTAYDTPMHYPGFGKFGNRLSWKLLNVVKAGFEQKIKKYLYKLNGIERKINAIGTFSPHLNLVACSGYVGNTYPDMPENFAVTGAWFVGEGIYNPPPEIIDFVKNGKADVVFTFGSMEKAEGEKTSNLLLKAVELSKTRAIIQQGWKDGVVHQHSPEVLFVDYHMPHHYLYRQAKVVVHLGGAGTVMEACKAGAASIVVPHLADQKYWGNILYKLGVAASPLSAKKLTPELLAANIQKVLNNQEMMQKAEELGAKVREEQGTDMAVKAIEDYVYKIR